jgi:hypothetical protein
MSDNKDYKKIYDDYKEQFEKLGKNSLEEYSKMFNTLRYENKLKQK